MINEHEISLINATLCEELGGEFIIHRPHDLKLISKQFDQLSSKPLAYRVAHVAYMLNKLRPFEAHNQKTAILAASMALDEVRTDVLEKFSSGLQSGQSVAQLCESLA